MSIVNFKGSLLKPPTYGTRYGTTKGTPWKGTWEIIWKRQKGQNKGIAKDQNKAIARGHAQAAQEPIKKKKNTFLKEKATRVQKPELTTNTIMENWYMYRKSKKKKTQLIHKKTEVTKIVVPPQAEDAGRESDLKMKHFTTVIVKWTKQKRSWMIITCQTECQMKTEVTKIVVPQQAEDAGRESDLKMKHHSTTVGIKWM